MLRGYNRILAEVRSMGGEIIGLTSESEGRASSARKVWELDFPLLSDPSCQLATFMNDNGWIASTIERSAYPPHLPRNAPAQIVSCHLANILFGAADDYAHHRRLRLGAIEALWCYSAVLKRRCCG